MVKNKKMIRMPSIVSYIIVFLIIIILPAGHVSGAEYHGLVSIDDYYSNDSSSSYDFHLLTTRLRLDAEKLNKAGNIAVHFEGRERNNLGSKDYNKSISSEQIDTLNLEYTGRGNIYIAAGRLWPKELYMERVDGINIVRQLQDSGFGFFAGAKPDPYTLGLNSNFTAAGGYYFYHKQNLSANLAFTHNGYKGKTDRQYIYGQASYSPSNKIRLFGTITADVDQTSKDIDLSNAIAELSYRPDYRKGLTIGYTLFRAVRLYQSMAFEIDSGKQQSYYVQGDYRLSDKYSLYGRFNLQTLNYNSLEKKLSSSTTYQIGLRNDNLLNRQISMDLNTTRADSYGSRYDTYEIQFSRFFSDVLQMTLHSAYMQSTSDITDYTDNAITYDLSGYYSISRMWNVSLSYQIRDAKDSNTNTLSSRVLYKF